MTRLAVLFSGGKDSCLALHKVLERGDDVRYLLNINPRNVDSFMFHKQDKDLLDAQVERLGIEMISVESDGVENEELDDLSALISKVKDDVDGIVVGGIASSYQGKRVKKICDDFGLKFVAPLWDYGPDKLWGELIGGAFGGYDSGEPGFEVVMIKIACDGIGKEWIGRVIDKDALVELKGLAEKFKFRLDFEGGEAETTVLNMPEYSSRIDVDFEVESEGEFRHLMRDVKIK